MHDLALEKSLQEALEQAFHLYGWLYYHAHDSRKDRPGFPDIIAVHPVTGRMIMWELKVEGKKVKGAQGDWQAALHLFSYFFGSNRERFEIDVIRPSDQDLALKLIELWAKP